MFLSSLKNEISCQLNWTHLGSYLALVFSLFKPISPHPHQRDAPLSTSSAGLEEEHFMYRLTTSFGAKT
jgi:hypothetical protein